MRAPRTRCDNDGLSQISPGPGDGHALEGSLHRDHDMLAETLAEPRTPPRVVSADAVPVPFPAVIDSTRDAKTIDRKFDHGQRVPTGASASRLAYLVRSRRFWVRFQGQLT